MNEAREKEHVRGVGEKEQRQYEHIKEALRNPAAMEDARKRSPPARC